MRRLRHLERNDYSILIGQKSGQPLLTSAGVLLERPSDRDANPVFELKLHAKFHSGLMNGIQITGSLFRNGALTQSVISSFEIWSVAENGWSETLVTTLSTSTPSPGVFTAYLDQATLGALELSGREVYAIRCEAMRKRNRFRAEAKFNHLGIYDFAIMNRRAIESLEVFKGDE